MFGIDPVTAAKESEKRRAARGPRAAGHEPGVRSSACCPWTCASFRLASERFDRPAGPRGVRAPRHAGPAAHAGRGRPRLDGNPALRERRPAHGRRADRRAPGRLGRHRPRGRRRDGASPRRRPGGDRGDGRSSSGARSRSCAPACRPTASAFARCSAAATSCRCCRRRCIVATTCCG